VEKKEQKRNRVEKGAEVKDQCMKIGGEGALLFGYAAKGVLKGIGQEINIGGGSINCGG